MLGALQQKQDDDSDEQTTAAPRIISRHREAESEEEATPEEEEEEDDELREARRAAVRERWLPFLLPACLLPTSPSHFLNSSVAAPQYDKFQSYIVPIVPACSSCSCRPLRLLHPPSS